MIGAHIVQGGTGEVSYSPIYGEIGSSYGPLFHQLDVRVDKTWFLRGGAIVGYLDVQNVYNRI